MRAGRGCEGMREKGRECVWECMCKREGEEGWGVIGACVRERVSMRGRLRTEER